MPDEGRVVAVEIAGQRYPIRSSLDPEYVARLATYVDEKMRAAADSSPSGDSMRLAVIAALNVADELFRCREASRTRNGELAERTQELERLVDRVLLA
jgi:cell division protein ZapA